jgi:hypothetical protein
VYYFYPAYYDSIVARLYNFDGKAVTPTQPTVISYVEEEQGGVKYKIITNGPNPPSFPTYEEAQAYVANQTSGNYRIVGTTPFISPVPLEEMKSYELVYQSNATVTMGVGGPTVPSVKVFKYLGSNQS